MAKDFDCNKCYHSKVCAYKMTFKDIIKSCNEYIPTADVVEVKHGEWIVVGRTKSRSAILKCSNCKRIRKGHGKSTFCPDCGAKMDGGKTE